ncbi:hypothetical protein TNCV_4891981 [Trichonephila clavipes]|nr:hypothetical protein TNCV_4891981 [Trichonephila clavipes]
MLKSDHGFVSRFRYSPKTVVTKLSWLALWSQEVSSLGTTPDPLSGRGSLVVKVSDHDWHVTSSSPIPLKTCRVGERSTLNLSRAQTSSCWCGS